MQQCDESIVWEKWQNNKKHLELSLASLMLQYGLFDKGKD